MVNRFLRVWTNKSKLLIFIFVVSIALAFSGCAQKPTAKEVLERMQQKYDSIESYKAEIHQIEIADGKTKETDSVVYFKKPDRFRTDYPPKKSGNYPHKQAHLGLQCI